MPVWVFCMIFCWGVLFIVLPVKIYQVYLFIYCPIWCRFSPSISLSNLGYVFHISIFSFVTSSWESINFTAFPSVIQTARAWGLQRGSICWNHSYKDTWARPPAQTAVVEATHMSPTKDLKLHTQDMTVSLSSGPQPFRQLHLSSTPREGVRRQNHLCKRRIQRTQTQHYAMCLTIIISHWLLSVKHFPRAGHKRNSCCLPFWNLELVEKMDINQRVTEKMAYFRWDSAIN